MSVTGLAIGWGTDIGYILQTWADMGIFAYALPFLLIFAIVFGILQATRMLGENKGVSAVIALAVGLLSLQWNYVPDFFAIIFPYAGVGIGILLVALILMGLFIDPKQRGFMIAFFVIGAVIALIVVLSALSSYDWLGGWWWDEYWPAIIALLVIGGLVAAVIFSSVRRTGEGKEHGPLGFWRTEK